MGGVGDEAYAKEVTSQLDSSKILRTFFVGSGRRASPFLYHCHVTCNWISAATLPFGFFMRQLCS